MVSIRLDPAVLSSIPSTPQKNLKEKIVDVAEVNQRCCIEESGRWQGSTPEKIFVA